MVKQLEKLKTSGKPDFIKVYQVTLADSLNDDKTIHLVVERVRERDALTIAKFATECSVELGAKVVVHAKDDYDRLELNKKFTNWVLLQDNSSPEANQRPTP